jgi:hypothetical protein
VAALLVLPAAFLGRETLDNAVPSKHASVHGEVAADHKGSHSGILLSQRIRLVCKIGLVLAAIDQDVACVPVHLAIQTVRRILPTAAAAETWREKESVSASSLRNTSLEQD